MNRILAACGAAALIGGVLAISPTAAVASSAVPVTGAQLTGTRLTDARSPELAALQRDLHLTAAEAKARLASDTSARSTELALRARLGSSYGGAWLNRDGTLVVGTTSSSKAALVRSMGATAEVVARSASQLDAVRTTLDRQAFRASRGVHSWYVDPATNAVVVNADTVATAKSFASAAGASASAVRTVVTSAAPVPMADVRGGDQFSRPVTGGAILCSIGFSVAGGYVTAGHCGSAGDSTNGFNGAAQGTFQASTFPGNDYAWVRVNSNWTPQPWVNNYSGGNVGVAGSQEAGIGASVCRSGRTTGWRCGVIQAKNVTVNYAQGAVYGLTQSNACAEGGDSGGSWISGNQAQGTTSGGTGNCTTGGTMFFQPLNPTLSHFGLSLVTTGGGSTSRIVGYGGKCIDVPSSNAVDGQYLQTWDCNGTGAQNWTFGSDGTLRALGLCMDVAWGSTANGAVIQLANCSGNAAQQFVLSSAGDLVNPQANKCVDVKDWNANAGARLQLWDCAGTANQKWTRG
jgi:streptogrisin C